MELTTNEDMIFQSTFVSFESGGEAEVFSDGSVEIEAGDNNSTIFTEISLDELRKLYEYAKRFAAYWKQHGGKNGPEKS